MIVAMMKKTIVSHGTAKTMPSSESARVVSDGEEEADRHPERRADQRRDDALVADHPPHLAPRHADRAEHPELARPLEDRQDERVDDAEEADDHGERRAARRAG